MQNDSALRIRIHNLSDEKLMEIIKKKDDYRPEAISYAQEELALRGGLDAVSARIISQQLEDGGREQQAIKPLFRMSPEAIKKSMKGELVSQIKNVAQDGKFYKISTEKMELIFHYGSKLAKNRSHDTDFIKALADFNAEIEKRKEKLSIKSSPHRKTTIPRMIQKSQGEFPSESSYIHKKCLNCGYERQQKDDQYGIMPLTECPKCGVIYEKIEKLHMEKEREQSPVEILSIDNETKRCPFCAETIKLAAIKCRYCQSDFNPVEVEREIEIRRSNFEQLLSLKENKETIMEAEERTKSFFPNADKITPSATIEVSKLTKEPSSLPSPQQNMFAMRDIEKPQEKAISYAGFWKRLAAAAIDFVIMSIGFFPIAFVFSIIFFNDGLSVADSYIKGMGLIFTWLYFALTESSTKQGTIGKAILGIKVIDLDGSRIGFVRATGRHFGKLLSGLLLFIGYIMVAFTQKKQGLHDIITECLVVDR